MSVRMIILRICLMLFTIGTATAADTEIKYYDTGIGFGQEKFIFPDNLPVVHFDCLCEKIVREIEITGRFNEGIKGSLHLALKLENNETTARNIKWNVMPLATYIRQDSNSYSVAYGHYLYEYYTGRKAANNSDFVSPFRENSVYEQAKQKTYPGRLFHETEEFKIQIYVMPSHFLFFINGRLYIKEYYGLFYKDEDTTGTGKFYNQFSDAVFQNVHVEGDVTIDTIKVRAGGPILTPTEFKELSKLVKDKPYLKGRFLRTGLDRSGNVNFAGFYDKSGQRLMKAEEEWEVLIRGRVGAMQSHESFEIIFEDGLGGGNYKPVFQLLSYMYEPPFLEIKSKRGWHSTYDYDNFPVNATIDMIKYNKYDSYYSKYTKNPFKKNTGFEMSVRRLSYSDQSDKYSLEPRSTVQVTVRVQCRVWTWYFEAHRYYVIDSLKTSSQVTVDEVILIT